MALFVPVFLEASVSEFVEDTMNVAMLLQGAGDSLSGLVLPATWPESLPPKKKSSLGASRPKLVKIPEGAKLRIWL